MNHDREETSTARLVAANEAERTTKYRELTVISSNRDLPKPSIYDRSQFEVLFQTIREVVADEMCCASQPIFVPIRRLTGLFVNAQRLAKRINTRRVAHEFVSVIGLLEQALHAVDVLNSPRGTTHTNVAEQPEIGTYTP